MTNVQNDSAGALPIAIDLGGTTFLDSIEFNMPHPDSPDPKNPKLTGWILTLAGPAHPKSVEVNLREARLQNKLANARDRARVTGQPYDGDTRDAEQVRADNVRDVTDRILGWSPAVNFKDGKGDRSYSPETCFDLFSDRKNGRFLALVKIKLDNERNFIPAFANV